MDQTKPLTIEVNGKKARLTGEKLDTLTTYICDLIIQGESERNLMSSTWEQNRSDYSNKPIPYVSNIIDGWQDIPAPFSQPRADALAGFTINSLVTQRPMVTCECSTPEELELMGVDIQDDRGKTLDVMFKTGGFSESCKSVAPSAWCTNCGIIRMLGGGRSQPLIFDNIMPEDFVCVGSGRFNTQTAHMVGHRFEKFRVDIESDIERGIYLDIDASDLGVSTRRKEANEPGMATTAPARESHDIISLYQVYPMLDIEKFDWEDGEPEGSDSAVRFNIVVDVTSKTILKIETYPFQYLCYFTFGYKPPPEEGFWHPAPVGWDMQGPHRLYNCLSNLASAGATVTAFPPMISEGGSFSRDAKYGFGEFVNMETGQLKVPGVPFNLQAVQAELARIERLGDSVARTSSGSIAQQYTKRMTATETASIDEGRNAGVSDYLETFSSSIPEMCAHAEELLAASFAEWKPFFGELAPVKSPAMFSVPAIWDVPGKMPNLNPQYLAQNTAVVMQIVTQIAGLAQTMGPMAFDFASKLLGPLLNAMDMPNAPEILAPFVAMGSGGMNGQPQMGAPGLVGGAGEFQGMGGTEGGVVTETPGAFAPIGPGGAFR
jgi:hypothetical protein